MHLGRVETEVCEDGEGAVVATPSEPQQVIHQVLTGSAEPPHAREGGKQRAGPARRVPGLCEASTCAQNHPHDPCHRLRDPRTWVWAGRLPPRLYHVTWVWACPATTQLRSSVCPSVTEGDEDSILTGRELVPEARGRGGVSRPQGAPACPPHSFSPQRPRT